MKKHMKVLCASVVAAGLIIGGAVMTMAADMKTITTTGQGVVTVEPDVCYMNLFARTRGKTAQEAKSENDKKVDAVVKALKAKGLTDEDIISDSMSLYPTYNYEKGYEEITGYEAYQNMNVTVKTLDTVGDFVDAAVGAGANINGLSYSVLERETAYIEALSSAVKNANVKADGIAKAMGVSVKGPVSVVEGASYNGFVSYKSLEAEEAAADMGAGAASRSYLSYDNIEISATVTIVYEY